MRLDYFVDLCALDVIKLKNSKSEILILAYLQDMFKKLLLIFLMYLQAFHQFHKSHSILTHLQSLEDYIKYGTLYLIC